MILALGFEDTQTLINHKRVM